MAYDFPIAPTLGQVYQGYVWDGEKWLAGNAVGPVVAVRKNYIINGAMMVSQENGSAAGTVSGYYPVDQFWLAPSNSGTTTAQQVASVTPGGSPNRLRVTATAADAAVAAGDYVQIIQIIEGLRIADLKSGSASAKTVTIQFGCKGPAGTYCLSIRSSAGPRSYVAEFTITPGEANTDVVKSVTINLDTTGTWTTDNTAGFYVTWSLMCGTTYQTTANSWQTGTFITTPNQSNFMGTAGNVFELFDVSLTVGTVAPPFVVPEYASELVLCQRYFQKYQILVVVTNVTNNYPSWPLSPPMRAAPAITPNFSGGTGATFIIGATGFYQTANHTVDAQFFPALNARM